MAQPQTQTQNGTSRAGTLPTTQMRSGSPAPRDMIAWVASPFGLMRRLTEDMDQLFTQLVAPSSALSAPTPTAASPIIDWMPAVETFERDGNLVVQTDLPGIDANDVTLEVEQGLLTISGERREERDIDEDGTRRTERQYGRFVRSIALPESVRTEEARAALHDGVLEVTIPLSQPSQPQRRRVEIQSARPESPAAASQETEK